MNNAPPDLPVVGPWAREKLDRLRAYLSEYTKIMKAQRWCRGYYFVDAFAGAGRATVRDAGNEDDEITTELESLSDAGQQEVIDGSPAVALGLEHPFTHYTFVEKNPVRLQSLRKLKAEYESRAGIKSIRVHDGDCNMFLQERNRDPGVDWKKWRAVVLLDPFGAHVSWATIAALGATGGNEVVINFPLSMAIQRLLPNDGSITPARRAHFNEYFGDPGWYELVYDTSQQSLFGSGRIIQKREGVRDRLVQWYRARLGSVFAHVSGAYLVRNSRGGPLYYLIWAGHNATGAKIAKYVLGSGELVRGGSKLT